MVERILPCGKVEVNEVSKVGVLEMIVVFLWFICRPEKVENSFKISRRGEKESGEVINKVRSSA